MLCECGGKTQIIDSREQAPAIRRRRKCAQCGTTFYTREVRDDSAFQTRGRKLVGGVVKRKSRAKAKPQPAVASKLPAHDWPTTPQSSRRLMEDLREAKRLQGEDY